VVLAPESVVWQPELFLAIDLDGGRPGERREAVVRAASTIERAWLEEDYPTHVRERRELFFDGEREKVRATITACYRDLALEAPRDAPVPLEEGSAVLAAAVRDRAGSLIAADPEAQELVARLRFVHRVLGESVMPGFDDARLAELAAQACAGTISLAEVKRDLAARLEAQLPREQRLALERQAPATLLVPSGSRIKLAYREGEPPALAVRLQEIFGWRESPALAGGRARVVLHILAPSHRPVQVTQDLASFWDTTYPKVRNELRARYPKHAWPDDPRSAPPQRGARRPRG